MKELDKEKTILIDKEKTTLISESKTNRTKKEEKTILLDKEKTTLISKTTTKRSATNTTKKSVSNIISSAFKGMNINGYVIDRLLSDAGGEAYIFLAINEKDSNEYIVKIYKQEFNLDKTILEKISKIDSPYVMKILDSGEVEGKHYEITPYYKFGTLQDNINKLSDEFLRNVFIKELNEGLKAIHDLSLVHNDIKPHNIFLSDDKKHIIIGDFGIVNDLNGRDYATKYVGGLSEIFSAPEAYRYTSFKVDYYSFGMTLYHLAFKGDPFKDMSSNRVRGMIANDNILIDSSLDSEIADLIYMLIRNSPKDRIDYDGVNEWLKNNSIYKSYRVQNENFKKGDFKISHEFKDTLYTSMYSLIEAMNGDYEYGYKHYINGFIQDDVEGASGKQELALELKDIRKKYNDDLDMAYFITLRKLNPKLEFNYKGINYKNFEGYINYCTNNYPHSLNEAFNKDILMTTLINYDKKVSDILEYIFELDIDIKNKFSLFLSYFSKEEKIYYDGSVFDSLKEFSFILFKGLDINHLSLDKDDILWEFLVYKYNFDNNLKNFKGNDYKTHCLISKLINGYVKLIYNDDYVLKNSKEILEVLSKDIETNKDLIDEINIVDFVKNGQFSVYYQFEEVKDEKFIELLNELVNEDEDTIIAKLYLYTSKIKKYFINGIEIGEIRDLVKYLENYTDLEEISTFILNDKYFWIWLDSKGYKVKESEY